MRAKLTRRGGIGVIALSGTLAAVGVGYAAIPSSDDAIHSCYNASSNPSGQLRVIDAEAGAKCAKNEKTLHFNQRGTQGSRATPARKDPRATRDHRGSRVSRGRRATPARLGRPVRGA